MPAQRLGDHGGVQGVHTRAPLRLGHEHARHPEFGESLPDIVAAVVGIVREPANAVEIDIVFKKGLQERSSRKVFKKAVDALP